MRWLIVGHGQIAKTFLQAAQGVGHEVIAVIGRDSERAHNFANRYGIGSFSEDPLNFVGSVDAAYIATPHSAHRDRSVELLNAGVPVLCEKPMAVNKKQTHEIVSAAKNNQTFLMEAMWTRHLPVYAEIINWIEHERIGKIKLIESSLGFVAPYEKDSRLWNPELAGGSLLDVGIYPLMFADLVLGKPPIEIAAVAELTADGIDAHLAMLLRYSSGALAKLSSAINVALPNEARIIGEDGVIEVPSFFAAEKAFLHTGTNIEEVKIPHEINGFEFQISEVARCLSEGLIQSPVVSWEWSLGMSELMENIRHQIDVFYPADQDYSNGI